MEQYQMPKELDWENLKLCLDNYPIERIYIRDCGGVREDGKFSCQGMSKVNETLEEKTLDFRKDDSGLYILIDEQEVFHFPLNSYPKGFSLAYERVWPTLDGIGRMVCLSTGVDPYDIILPEPNKSILRGVMDDHLIEIYFKDRVHLQFHSWKDKPHWKYWQIALEGQEPDKDFIKHWMMMGYNQLP